MLPDFRPRAGGGRSRATKSSCNLSKKFQTGARVRWRCCAAANAVLGDTANAVLDNIKAQRTAALANWQPRPDVVPPVTANEAYVG